LTERQYDLLKVLSDNHRPFCLKDLHTDSLFRLLYGRVSVQTARRDIQKLREKNLIIPDKGGNTWVLNVKQLG
jgi:DeoR/GlpR family transcriptional regulator of sugar metabolism